MKKITKATIVFASYLIFILIVWVVAQTQTQVSVSGIIATRGLEVRTSDGLSIVTSIDWGLCERGQTTSKAYRVYNTGTVDLSLSMVHDLESTIGVFDWDSESVSVLAGNFVDINFSLTIDLETTATTFSFTIYIQGS